MLIVSQNKKSHSNHPYALRGFTIVELLIAIVIIAILAAITVVAYSGIQQRARNSSRVAEAKQWQTLLSMYRAQNSTYPISSGGVCLGEGFPKYAGSGNALVGSCWDANSTTSRHFEDVAFNNLVRTIGSLPQGDRTPILGANGTTYRVGPIFWWNAVTPYISYFLEGDGACPLGTKSWSDAVNYRCNLVLST